MSVSACLAMRIGSHEPHLSHLVAAKREPNRIVALDEQAGPAAKRRPQSCHLLDRRGLGRERNRRQRRERAKHTVMIVEHGLHGSTDRSRDGSESAPITGGCRSHSTCRHASDLQAESSVITAELRPPRAELATAASMDAWIDTYHAVKSLTRAARSSFSQTAPSDSRKKTTCGISSSTSGTTFRARESRRF